MSGPRHPRELGQRDINTTIPYTVDENGALTDQAPGFTGKRVINDKGEKGDANEAVIKALTERGMRFRPWPPQAPISAFMAFEEAGHFSQYTAMVHCDGQTYQGRPGIPEPWIIADNGQAVRRHAARARAARDLRDAVGRRPPGRTASTP